MNAPVFDRQRLKELLAGLAESGVYLGTSSWKYGGWRGLLYDEQRYIYRGKFAESRFEKYCLGEFAEVFKTVCVDAGYYRFPDQRFLEGLVSQVPDDFRFTFKVTDDITIKKFSNLPRFGIKAGKPNPNFLNADLFASAFIAPLEAHKNNIGMVIFEFSKFYSDDYKQGRDFLCELDRFLETIPRGWNYGVEIRNKLFLAPEYFAVLAKHGVAHVFNSWTEMPPVVEQMALAGSRPRADLVGARLLLRPGRKFEDAVKMFSPYAEVKDPNEEVRQAARELLAEGVDGEPGRKTFIYINNRLEGNAIWTIFMILLAWYRLRLEPENPGKKPMENLK